MSIVSVVSESLRLAVMILKSAIELSIETSKIASGQELDRSRFTRAEERAFEKHRRNYFKSWLLFSLERQAPERKFCPGTRKTFRPKVSR
jgi:hypothetical protein